MEDVINKMRSDWDRRLAHDYRFWMSDGEESDAAMWQAGERDFLLLMEGLPSHLGWTALEIGCGVGRLLRPALHFFERVIGVDISEIALAKAKELVGQSEKLQLVHGNGVDLGEIKSNSIDIVFSFAAITSCPTKVIASYLRECGRIVRPGGLLRFQVYLGSEQQVGALDTLHLRCFERERFCAALEACGFETQWVKDLTLPFEASCKELGIEAKIIAAQRAGEARASLDEIEALLLSQGKESSVTQGPLADLERYMVARFVETLRNRGESERAERASAYALCLSPGKVQAATNQVAQLPLLLSREGEDSPSELGGTAREGGQESGLINRVESLGLSDGIIPYHEAHVLKGLKVLEERADHPRVVALLKKHLESPNFGIGPDIRAVATSEGPCLEVNGNPLDNPTKPISAARVWRSRNLTKEISGCEGIIVFGLGAGYELDELTEYLKVPISVVVPRPDLLVAALAVRDLSRVLERVHRIIIGSPEEIQNALTSMNLSGVALLVRPQSQAFAPELCSAVKTTVLSSRVFASLRPSHAVIGPLQGGTLPMIGYVHRALDGLHQRSRIIDFSPFAPSFHQIEQLVRDKVRRLVLQNSYLEVVTALLREQRQEKPFDIAIFMAQAPVSLKVLEDLRSQGVITVLWFVEDYLRFSYWKELARGYDFVFTVQKGACIEAIKAAGAGEVHYLPVACDPGVHRPMHLSPEERARWGSPVSFVGAGYHNRQQVFAALSHYPLRIWGTEWPEAKPFDRLVQEGGRRLAPEEYNKIFNATEININLHSSAERDGVDPTGDFLNPRLFELAAAGAFQLVDERSLMGDVFTPGHDVVTFANVEDLKEKIDFYLAHPEERQKIVRAARETVLAKHTYAHRMREMLSIIYASRYEQLRDVAGRSAWGRMLKASEIDSELHARCTRAFERGEDANLDGLVADIVAGDGKLTETEQKLLFLFHVRKQMILIPSE